MPATNRDHDCYVKRWAVAHPLLFCVLSTFGWYSLLLVSGPVVATLLPVGLVWVIGWWRETGLRWQWPTWRWWLVLPPLVAAAGCLVIAGRFSFAVLTLAVSVEIAGRGLAHFALRGLGSWRAAPIVTVLYAGADLLLVPVTAATLVFAVAAGFCLTALRWRLNTIWPLAILHGVLLASLATGWWLLPFAIGLVGYGCWLLRGYPLKHMALRPTVRVLCFDHQDRVLLVCWRDPSDGTLAWDAPGGGIKPGETPLQTARREMGEELGLPQECVIDQHVPIQRDTHWDNARYVGVEPCYFARVGEDVSLNHAGLEPHEVRLIREFRWVAPAKATSLPGRVQLLRLAEVAELLAARVTA